jgi:hypothetical protein
MFSPSQCTLFKVVGLRKDDVHRRLHDEFDSLDLSKINLEKFEPVEAQMNASAYISPFRLP